MPTTPTFLDLALKLTEIRTLTGELSEFDKAFLAPHAALEECLSPLLRLALERPEDMDNVRVKVAVIGNFSAGKSTLINAILGRPVCPMKVGESTVGYTSFRYADREEIHRVTHSDKGSIREILTLEQYAELVAAGGDAGGWFDYGYPFHGLRDIELIDTPGFIGSNPQADKLTEKITKEADVALAVFDINEGEPKRDLLQRLKSIREDGDSQLKRLFLVLNKADALPDEAERQTIVKVCEKNGLFDDIQVVSARDILQGCYFHDLADVGPRLRASIGHVMKQRCGGRWSLEIKLASDRPQQYSLDIGGDGDANTPGGRMALIRPLVEIQGDKTNLLRAQRTRAIQQELTRTLAALDNIHSHCAKATGETETGVAFDGEAYWDIANSHIVQIGNMLEATLQQHFQCGEIPNSGVFENDGYLSIDLDALETFATSQHLRRWRNDFANDLIEKTILSGSFERADEIVEALAHGFEIFVVNPLRDIKNGYGRIEGATRSGSRLKVPFDSKNEATKQKNEWIAMDVETIRSEAHRFFLGAQGTLTTSLAASDAAIATHGKNRAALAAKNIEKTEAALGLAAQLLEAHRSQLASPKN